MDAFVIYLLKMLTCSAILYGYYRVALYNERFHQWNRFYILAAFILSIVVPFISLPVVAYSDHDTVTRIIGVLPWNAIRSADNIHVTWQQVALVLFALTSILLVLKLISGIIRIIRLYKTGTTHFQQNIQLIITAVKDAPFSFFNWLFWREDIDPATENGKRILQHELAHIQQHHSIDKVFSSLVLCIFWINPFFWLLRKELYMIHEFLADKKAINNQDGAAFAYMILQAIPLNQPQSNSLINPFFSSKIKRRLFMITTSNLATFSYVRRISGLAIMVMSMLFIAVSVHNAEAQTVTKKTITRQTEDTTIRSNKKRGTGKEITIQKTKKDVKEGKEEVIIEKIIGPESIELKKNDEQDIFNADPKNTPLYLIDGKETNAVAMKSLDPKLITTVDVIKGQKAIDTYGDKAKNGVIKISTTKSGIGGSGEKIIIKTTKPGNPLIYVDGKPITQEEMNLLNPNDIESMNVLKGESAIKKYGNKGSEGVIEIVMKKAV